MPYICKNPWTTLFIWGNGNVTHCCYSNIGSLGNIKETPLMDIWRGEKLNCVRENMRRGDYLRAGCEYFCRSYRWNELYGSGNTAPSIPEGLGRVEALPAKWAEDGPGILGFGIDWDCNLKCRHCLASRKGGGVSRADFLSHRPFIERSRFLRFMGGEFTINKDCLATLKELGTWDNQPTVFFSTNGQTSIASLLETCGGLKGFHLKFSLEGLGEGYERVRLGGFWEVFEQNLNEAARIFSAKRAEGRDWKLFLNFCVMRSNFGELPAVMRYAVEKDLPLVLNTINGMRHIDENMFMYSTACPPPDEIARVEEHCKAVLREAPEYCFRNELSGHLDYTLRCARGKKLGLPRRLLKVWNKLIKGHAADLSLYALYRLAKDPSEFPSYAARKLREKLRRGHGAPRPRLLTIRKALSSAGNIAKGWTWSISSEKVGLADAVEYAHRLASFSLPIKERAALGGQNTNRLKNMRLACAAIDRTVLLPGKIFSMQRLIGEPTGENGYLPGPVIVGGRLSSSPGGGLCQISTVLFNAALLADMNILEKHNHSVDLWGEDRMVGLGLDAVYAYALKDLKFRNTHSTPVLIQISVDDAGKSVTADFYATAPETMTVRLETNAQKKMPGKIVAETRRYSGSPEKQTYFRRETYRAAR